MLKEIRIRKKLGNVFFLTKNRKTPSMTMFIKKYRSTTQNLLRITFSFNDFMLKTNRLKKRFFFYKDRLIFRLDDPVANMSIRHVYDA